MAKTKAQIIAQLAKGFRDAGMIVERGPFEIRNEQGEIVLIAENRVRAGQMRLPIGDAPAGGAGRQGSDEQ